MKVLKVLAFGFLGLIVLVLIGASVLGKLYGTDKLVYDSLGFTNLWIVATTVALLYLFRQQLHRRPVIYLLHLSFVVILYGASMTRIFGEQGSIHLRKGVAESEYIGNKGQVKPLPFGLILQEFSTEFHAGTNLPKDYVSRLTVKNWETATVDTGRASMNRVFTREGYRFFQSHFDPDGQGVTLLVNHDPWGTNISYAGYFLLLLAMILALTLKDGPFRTLLQDSLLRKRPEAQEPSMLARLVLALQLTLLLGLSILLILRGIEVGQLPLGNGPDTMRFMAWCSVLLSLIFRKRFPLAVPFGLLLCGITFLVSIMGHSRGNATLAPVLNSSLLSIHVSLVMTAYSLLAFLMLNGLAGWRTDLKICKVSDESLQPEKTAHLQERAERLLLTGRLLLFPAVFLLAAGIFTGAVWANQSWGNYWSWDPKEVWALITLLVYAMAFHGESWPAFRRPVFFHRYVVLAFLTVLMTWFGVNYLLGGMHAYQ